MGSRVVSMDAKTSLRRRVGDTPLRKAPRLAQEVGVADLRIKLEGANPTGTQKDRIARLEVGVAAAQKSPGVTIASCGNFGVAMAHRMERRSLELAFGTFLALVALRFLYALFA